LKLYTKYIVKIKEVTRQTERERHVMTTNPDFKVTVLFEGKYLKTIYNSFTQPAV